MTTPLSPDIPRPPWRSKEQLLADYALKDAQVFLQIDGWHGVEPDAVFTPDQEGDAIFYGIQQALRASPASLAVRVQVHATADRDDVRRLWDKLSAALETALDYLEQERRGDSAETPSEEGA